MLIANGGLVEAPLFGWLVIGKSDATGAGTGIVTVRGSHATSGLRSTLDLPPLADTGTFGDMVVGWGGAGLLRIEDGGLVRTRSAVIGRDQGSGMAVATGQGQGGRSTWDNSAELLVGSLTTGTLQVEAGSSPGTLTIKGDYTQGAASVLAIEIGGLEAGYDYDELAVTDAINFAPGAKIRITFIDPNPNDAIVETFVPRTADVFSFLVADTITLPPGASLNDLIEFTNLPFGVALDFQTSVVEGNTIVTGTATSTLPPGGLRITAHPHHVVAAAGTVAMFTVQVEGAAGFTYQWLRDGLPIHGATDPAFTLPSAQPADAAPYSVIISAGGDSVVSKVATLSITAPPQLSVTRVAGDIVLSWPTLPGGFSLQSLSAFDTEAGWEDTTAPATISNGQNFVTLPTTEAVQLFRLKYEP